MNKIGLALAISVSLAAAPGLADAQRYYGRPAYHHHHHGRGNGGAIAAAGIIGLVAGAAIASSQSQRYDPPPAPVPYDQVDPYTSPYPGSGDFHAYCASKFSTYDPRTGYYMASDGRRYPCH